MMVFGAKHHAVKGFLGTEIWGCSQNYGPFFQFWLGLYCGTTYARVQKWDPKVGSYPHVSPGPLKVTFRVQRLRFRIPG